jgi:hypothetical protein
MDYQRLAMMMLAVAVAVRLAIVHGPYIVTVLDRMPPLNRRD